MKVIAQIESREFICEVHETELQKFLDTYYNGGETKRMKVGVEIDLGKGYDFLQKIKEVQKDIKQFIKTNGKEIREIIRILK